VIVAGIASYGAYVPRTRLPLSVIGGGAARDGGPEKAVAWNDEDSVTMAVTAAVNCLRGIDRSAVDGVMFASTTYAFREKQAAALIAKALDLPRGIRTADFSGSLRAGTAALRSAIDAVAAGSARNVLVIASDSRMGAPGSGLERTGGDGAVAFLVADVDAVASLSDSCAVSDEIVDLWRGDGDRFVHSWEDRFVIQEGFTPNMIDAATGVMGQLGLSASDYASICLYAPDARSHAGVARGISADRNRLQDPLFGRLGNTGTAFAGMQLAAALETAKAGDRILVVNYGDGAEALSFEVTDAIEKLGDRRGVSWNLARRRVVSSYDKYIRARNLDSREWVAGGDPGLSATVHFRERDEDISFCGQKCLQCSAIQFPNQRVCETCFAKDDFEKARLSDRIGRVVTYTFDFFFPTPDPPTVVTVTEIDGARVHLQLVNVAPADTRIGMPVEFEFRRIHEAGGRPNYYWKGSPLPESDEVNQP